MLNSTRLEKHIGNFERERWRFVGRRRIEMNLVERSDADWDKCDPNTRVARTQLSSELIYHYKDSGYLVKIVDSAINMAINVFVRPELEAATTPLQYIVNTVSWETYDWCGSWWVRLIRWLQFETPVRHIIPDAIMWLCYAMHPVPGWESRSLPNDLLERIQAQKLELIRRGETPSLVLLGGKAMFEIQSHPKMMHPEIWMDTNFRFNYVYGLEIRASPWLSKDSVVVV